MMTKIKLANNKITGKGKEMASQIPAVFVVTAPTDMAGQLKDIGNRKKTLFYGSGKACLLADLLL